MKKPIKLGIVGLGRAGWGMHCEELQSRTDLFQIVAVCDERPDRCAKAAERYGCRTYATIEALLQDAEVEVVDIATRSNDHFAHASLALKAGKTVFLEKPMTTNYQEALALQAQARTSAGKLYVRHNRRFEPAFAHIREILATGILGSVYEIKLRRVGYQRRADWQTIQEFGGGQLLNWGPHIIDHALRLLESPVVQQNSDLKCIAAAGDAEDHLKIVLKGENGRLVDLEISGGAALGEPEYLIWGTTGALKAAGDTITLRYLDPEHPLAPVTANPQTPQEGGFGSSTPLPWVEKTIAVQPSSGCDTPTIWDHLYATIREGKPFPISLEEAVEVMKVVTEAKKGTGF